MSTSPRTGSTSVQLHFKERSCGARPLYRPAALRRNGVHTPLACTEFERLAHHYFCGADSRSSNNRIRPSPPQSPSVAASEAKSWLGALSTPWSPVAADAFKDLTIADVKGRMLPRSEWKPDDEAQTCGDQDCYLRFDLLNRRHHCRACGDVFCASHSSRATFLWPANEEEQHANGFTPRGTPRGTPRSSTLDLPSLAYSTSPSSSSISTSSSSTATSTSPVPPPLPSLPAPVSARVCDRCYFSAPTPLLTPPPSNHSGSFSFNASPNAPLTLRHPRSRQHSASRTSSPAHSPPGHHSSSLGRTSSSRVRSRTGSAASVSAGSSDYASYPSPATSIEALSSVQSNKISPPRGHSSRRNMSPAACRAVPVVSLRKFSTSPDPSSDEDGGPQGREEDGAVQVDAYGSDSDDEAKHEQMMRERRRHNQEFGSVQGGPWQSWATF
ncbi:hypothetical protein JCM11491_002061 [Sporobolomyces phaffii]